MKRFFLFVIFSLLCISGTFAQLEIPFLVSTINYHTNKKEPGASVTVYEGETVVQSKTTPASGDVRLILESGRIYKIEFSKVGKVKRSVIVNLTGISEETMKEESANPGGGSCDVYLFDEYPHIDFSYVKTTPATEYSYDQEQGIVFNLEMAETMLVHVNKLLKEIVIQKILKEASKEKTDFKEIVVPPNSESAKIEKQVPPSLYISNITFKDQNNILEGNETSSISFYIKNKGKGSANNIRTSITNTSNIKGIDFKTPNQIKVLLPNDSVLVSISLFGKMELTNGNATLKLSFTEDLGFPPEPIEITFQTKEFEKPMVKVVDYSFTTENGKVEKAKPIVLKVIIQNVGQGKANEVSIKFNYPTGNIFLNSENSFNISELKPNESKEIIFDFQTNKLYTDSTIPILIELTEKYKLFAQNKNVIATLNTNSIITSIKIDGYDDTHKIDIKEASLTSEVDKNIPKTLKINPYKYALIIGNEDYSSKQSGLGSESNVEFAVNDAKTFYEYAVNTLGIPKENCFLLLNATSGEMTQKINVIFQILTRLGNTSEIIFFYAGHGHPDEISKIPYLVPVDVSATNLQSAIKVTDLYAKLAQTKTKRITVFLDACFTGGGREQGLLASRAVKVVPKENTMTGNMVVYSATSNEQSALPFKEKQHGMFTYYLLKKLQDSKGQVSYSELAEYIKKEVSIESLKINSKEQDPQVNVSSEVIDTWGSWRLNE